MMGHHEPLKNGDEVDVVSTKARKFLSFRTGVKKKIKTKMSRRARRNAKREAWNQTT